MYHAYGLLLPTSDFTLLSVAKKLAVKFPKFRVDQVVGQVVLSSGEWEMRLGIEEGPEVLEESRRIADHIGGAEDELGIRSCNRRVDVSSDVPDPEMDHFNDYLQVIEVLQTFRGVIPIDPHEPSLL